MSSHGTKTILILDDESQRRAEWKERLSITLASVGLDTAYDVRTIEDEELQNALLELHRRRRVSREGSRPKEWNETAFDRADILFVDYDLFEVGAETDLTGEAVSYLARCFSRCGFIVSVNQFEYGKTTFDLRMTGYESAFADAHISPQDIANPNLWVWNPTNDGFRPWHWPLLPDAAERYARRVEQLSGREGTEILRYLELKETPTLSSATLQFLSGHGRLPEETTFEQFVSASDHGLRHKDKPWSDDAIARIAASRIAKWLEHAVLPGQHVLVDAPHLVLRFPSLLTVERTDPTAWDGTASPSMHENGALDGTRIVEASFEATTWLGRPAWYWHKLKDDERIVEVADPWSTTSVPVMFLEDTSRFALEGYEFVADVDSPYKTRHVRKLENVRYVPELRLALGEGKVRAERI